MSDNKNKQLGMILKELRKKSGMTQQEVANKIGIKSKGTISMWETGRTLPDVFTFLILCCTYNVPEAQAFINALGLANSAELDFATLAPEKHSIDKITLSFNDGTEEVINKGFICGFSENEAENTVTSTMHLVDVNQEELRTVVLLVMEYASKIGMFDETEEENDEQS